MSLFASTGGNHGGESFSLIHSDSHHADAIIVPDAALLFTGNFHRAGLDLVLTGHDGHHYVVAGYFANEHPPTLMAPNGAHLSPDIVDLLAGSPAPNEYAQAQPTSATPPDSIGKVQKVVGTVTVLRNGVSVALNVGDVVYKSDVIVTGADSKVGVTFPDGTALELLANTRMAVNEYNYDASSSSNKALFTLVEGTFGFVAGKVAHAGDMKIGTPVATMGIRGTTGVVQHVVNATLGDVTYSFSVYDDPGTTTSGSWDMVVQNPDGTFSVVATVSQTGYVTYVTPQGRGLPPLVTTVPLSASQVAANQLIIQDLFETFALGGPHSIGIPGSPENPLPFIRLNFLPDIFGSGGPHAYNSQLAGLPGLPPLQLELLQSLPQQQQQQALSNIFIWAAGNGTWPTGSQWNQGISPGGAQPEVILQSGMVQYSLTETIYTLTIDAPAELDMIGGSLVVTNGLDVAGTLLVDGDPPIFLSYGTTTIEASGQVIAGALSVIEFSPDLSQPITAPVVVDNFGTITAQAAGIIEFIDATVTNEAAAQIESTDLGSVVDFTDTTFVNDGSVVATGSGGVFFVNSAITNAAGASITAKLGGSVTFATSSSVGNPLGIVANLVNDGQIAAQSGGTVNIDIGVTNEAAGQITSTGEHSTVSFDGSALDNFGAVSAGDGGTVNFVSETLTNETGGQVTASGGVIKFDGSGGFVTNLGTIQANNAGEIEFDGIDVDNRGGTIEADGAGSIVQLSAMTVIGGTLVTGDLHSNDDGIIEIVATRGATVFDGAQHGPVTIEGFVQVDTGAELELKGTIDNNGTIDVDGETGAELIISGTVTLNDSGNVILDQCNDEIVSNGSASELDNYNTISGEGIIGDQYLTLHNETGGVIDADHGGRSLVLDTGSNTIDNDGTLEATFGATIRIDSNVDNENGRIEALSSDDQGSTVELDGITVSGGKISIDADSELHIEHGTTILSDVDVENSGDLLIDSGSIVAILDVEAGTTIHGGTITIGSAGELDVCSGSGDDVTTFNDVTIYDSGAFNIDGPLTVEGDIIIDRECGTFTDTGVLTVDTSAKLEGENFGKQGLQFGEIDIGTNATLTLENAGAKEIDFTGSGGTLTLDTPLDFSGSIKDFAPGDTIDLAGIKAISVFVQGDEIIVNEGGCASYSLTLSDPLPSGDTIAFKSDGSGGTDLEVVSQALNVADSQVSGTEGTAIDLNIPDAITGGSQLTSLVISGIPDGATLSDNGVTLTVTHGSITLDATQIAGLAITTANDTNFTLSLLATATDGHGFEYTVPATETVTVDPLAPTVEPSAVSGVEGAPIALNLGISPDGLAGDNGGNSLHSVTISDIPDGAKLSDSNGATLTITNGSITLDAQQIADGDLNGLAITTSDGNFKLNVSAIEQDKDGDLSAAASGTESVSVTAGFTFVPTAAALSALEDHGLVLTAGEQIGSFFENGGNSSDTYSFTISGPDHDFSSSSGPNSEALFTNKVLGNAFDFDGSTVYALTVDVKDVTLGEDSGPLPFDVVVDDSFLGFGDSHDIKLTGAHSLGINAATPTIVYGLGGNDTIDATGMTANVWFVGGAGSDTMTGGSGVNTYVFASVGESETPREYGCLGGATDTITNFNASSDVIDLAPMNTVTCIQGLLTDPSTHINPDSVAWIVSGSEVIVYANTDPFDSHWQDSSSGYESEIILSASSHDAACALADDLSAKNFILAPPPPSTPDLTPASDTGVSNADGVTKDTTPTFTGAGTAGDVVTLFDGSMAIGSAVVGSDGCYTITSSALSNGTHWISAEQTDALGDTSALSCSVPVTIDTKAPTLSSITTSGPGISDNGKGDLDAGHTVTFTVNFSENVYVTGTPTAGLNDGGTATYVGGSGTNSLTFTYTVANGENTSDLALGSTGIALNGGAIQDSAGNDALLTASDSYNPQGTLKIDTTPPTVSSITMSDAALKIGDTSTVTITFSEAVTGFSNSDVTMPNGTLGTLTSSDGGVTWKGTFTPSSGVQDDTNTITVSSNYTDLAGNKGSGATSSNYTVHTVTPVIAVPSGTQTLTSGTQASISGVSLSESGSVAGETFSATVTDNHGALSATGGTSSNGGHTLTFTGLSLSDLKNDLASLTDTDSTPGSDTITVNATDSFGNAAAQQTIAVSAVNPAPPLGFAFTPDAATLSSLEDDDHLDNHTQIGTFTETGGNAGDSYTFTIGGTSIGSTFKTSAGTNSEALLTNGNVGGGHDVDVYALTVQVNDTTHPSPTSALPFDVVVGNSHDNTINLETGSNNLGIAASTPTIVYGLDDNDTISASGMTANVWFVGGAGQDTMTGGSGQNVYLYAAVSESDNGNEWGCGPDTITNFTHGRDVLDFDPLSGVSKIQGKVSDGTELSANSIAWVVSGGNTIVYVNTDSERHSMTSDSGSVMEIVLDNITNLAASDFILSNGSVAPAGVAGRPINLALNNPVSADGAPVEVTIKGVPSDWQLNEGTNLGNGTWTIQSDDLSQLAITTAAAFAGAMVLSVTETWANADGTTGAAVIADNVEAYASGSPIFALAGDDNLSGAGGGDTFVFAQPIGNDTIYNFNAASDRIDLTGFVGIGGYGDLHIADDAGGNAVIVLGSGETITLRGVDAAALSAADFVFNQAPVTENHATMTVSDGAVLPLSGTIDNTGMIAIESTGSDTVLQVTGDGVTLDGGGKVVMSDDAAITGTNPSDVLTNVDNTISGSGQIGTGDGNLTLVNDAHGTINADVAGSALVLDTGHAIANAGLLEATNGGLLQVVDAVNGGSADIAGGTMSFEAQSNVNVSFDNGQSGTDYGKLQLDNPAGFSGHIAGFTGTDAAHSDIVDLAGIDFSSARFAETYHSATGVLSVTDGTHSANLTLDNFQGALDFASDGNGGTAITAAPADASPSSADTAQGALSFADSDAASDLSASVTPEGQSYVGSLTTGPVTESNGTASVDYGFSLGSDQINVAPGQTVTQSYQVSLADAHNPAASACQTVSVSIGGAGNDNFVFTPGAGADTIVNFDAQHDAIELDHFANVQTVQELQSLITSDAHDNAFIDLGNHDSITVNGMTAAQLQANLQNLVHLH